MKYTLQQGGKIAQKVVSNNIFVKQIINKYDIYKCTPWIRIAKILMLP